MGYWGGVPQKNVTATFIISYKVSLQSIVNQQIEIILQLQQNVSEKIVLLPTWKRKKMFFQILSQMIVD